MFGKGRRPAGKKSLVATIGAFTVGAGAVLAAPATSTAAEQCQGEAAAFEAATAAGTPEALQDFLTKYPTCALSSTVFGLLTEITPAAGTPEPAAGTPEPAAGTPEPAAEPRRDAGPDDPGRNIY